MGPLHVENIYTLVIDTLKCLCVNPVLSWLLLCTVSQYEDWVSSPWILHKLRIRANTILKPCSVPGNISLSVYGSPTPFPPLGPQDLRAEASQFITAFGSYFGFSVLLLTLPVFPGLCIFCCRKRWSLGRSCLCGLDSFLLSSLVTLVPCNVKPTFTVGRKSLFS